MATHINSNNKKPIKAHPNEQKAHNNLNLTRAIIPTEKNP
jgi:hypothetical protein